MLGSAIGNKNTKTSDGFESVFAFDTNINIPVYKGTVNYSDADCFPYTDAEFAALLSAFTKLRTYIITGNVTNRGY